MQEIKVETTFGTLCAVVGGDTEYPEILVYLRRNAQQGGGELMVAAVTDNAKSDTEDALRIAVYADPNKEDYTDRFLLTKEQLEDPKVMWQ